MGETAIWEWEFKTDGDTGKVMQAAARLVEDLNIQEQGVEAKEKAPSAASERVCIL